MVASCVFIIIGDDINQYVHHVLGEIEENGQINRCNHAFAISN